MISSQRPDGSFGVEVVYSLLTFPLLPRQSDLGDDPVGVLDRSRQHGAIVRTRGLEIVREADSDLDSDGHRSPMLAEDYGGTHPDRRSR